MESVNIKVSDNHEVSLDLHANADLLFLLFYSLYFFCCCCSVTGLLARYLKTDLPERSQTFKDGKGP